MNFLKDYKTKNFVAGFLIVFLIGIFIMPFVWFGIGAFVGLILKITIGGLLETGFSLFNLDITRADLPVLCGTISVIASFFKNTININKQN